MQKKTSQVLSSYFKEVSGKHPKTTKLIFIFLILFVAAAISKGVKPSVCDCKTVMYYEEGSVDAAKRILKYDGGVNFMSAAQRECGLKYWDEIDNWAKTKGLYGTPVDNAMLFFYEKCK
jgi:hypothetical protein